VRCASISVSKPLPAPISSTRCAFATRLRTDVAENEGKLPHRVLLAFSPSPGECFCDDVLIRGPDQHYSPAYCALTEAFYLFM